LCVDEMVNACVIGKRDGETERERERQREIEKREEMERWRDRETDKTINTINNKPM